VPGAAAWLRSRTAAVVLTHAKPDGDAAGSTLAIARTLIACGVGATIVYVGPVPRWLGVIAGKTPFIVLDPASGASHAALDALDPDAAVITDTGSWSQLEHVKAWLAPRRALPDRPSCTRCPNPS